jgi:hypothetical protein
MPPSNPTARVLGIRHVPLAEFLNCDGMDVEQLLLSRVLTLGDFA